MPESISIAESGLFVELLITHDSDVRLIHFAPYPYDEQTVQNFDRGFRLVELQADDRDGMRFAAWGNKHHLTQPGWSLRYVRHSLQYNEHGKLLTMELGAGDLRVDVYMQFYAGVPMARTWSEVINHGHAPRIVTFISSFFFRGLNHCGHLPWEEVGRVYFAHQSWCGELKWKSGMLRDFGLERHRGDGSTKRLAFTNNASFSSQEFLPAGLYENTEQRAFWFWQIESSGAWHWELGEFGSDLYLCCSGPAEIEHGWWRRIGPGERLRTVPAAVGAVRGGLEQAFTVCNRYRRILRPAIPTEHGHAPVIFNDEKPVLTPQAHPRLLQPLIRSAASAGCEVFVINRSVEAEMIGPRLPVQGASTPTREVPDLRQTVRAIREAGMRPGVVVEIESVPLGSTIAERAPDAWFFRRHGRRVIFRERLQLDFRNPDVRAHANALVNRLIADLGIEYLKLDYNFCFGSGTDEEADSAADGALGHQRAYLAWVDGLRERYPGLILENGAGGGMRMDYAMLSRYHLQTLSDEDRPARLALIAAASPTALPVEQSLVWCAPTAHDDLETVTLACVNSIGQGFMLSGPFDEVNDTARQRVHEAIAYHKDIREHLCEVLPFWPLGLPHRGSKVTALGLMGRDKVYLIVWKLGHPGTTFTVPIPQLARRFCLTRCSFPHRAAACEWNVATGLFSVHLEPDTCARVFEVEWTDGG